MIPAHERKAVLAAADRDLRALRAKYPHIPISRLPGTGRWVAGELSAASAEELGRKLAGK